MGGAEQSPSTQQLVQQLVDTCGCRAPTRMAGLPGWRGLRSRDAQGHHRLCCPRCHRVSGRRDQGAARAGWETPRPAVQGHPTPRARRRRHRAAAGGAAGNPPVPAARPRGAHRRGGRAVTRSVRGALRGRPASIPAVASLTVAVPRRSSAVPSGRPLDCRKRRESHCPSSAQWCSGSVPYAPADCADSPRVSRAPPRRLLRKSALEPVVGQRQNDANCRTCP